MSPEGRRLALIVASSEFSDETLQQLVTPVQDADALARVLEDAEIGGFEVAVLADRPSHEVRREIEAFFTNRKRDDLLLLYFSGHGVKDDDGRLYLATIDTQRGLLRSTAVPTAFVNETMTASRSRRQALILDCCYSGAFARGTVAKGGESVDIRNRFGGQGRVVLTASNATQYAFQGDEIIGEGSRSVFTHHLVRGLETGQADLDGDGWVSLNEIYHYVYERVTDETPQQTPGKWTFDLQGDILIARNPHWTVKPVELPSELLQAIENPLARVREAAVDELDHLLRGSHPGLALAAREALARLADDDSRRVSLAATRALTISPIAVPAKPPPTPPPPVAEKPSPEPKPEPRLHPSLAIKLSVKPRTVDVGDEAKWTVTLRNDGDDDLRDVTVKHRRTLLNEPFDLTAGKERRFAFTTTYETEGKRTEKVTATGIASNGESMRDEAGATVQVRTSHTVTPKAKPVPKRKPQTVSPKPARRPVAQPVAPAKPQPRTLWGILVLILGLGITFGLGIGARYLGEASPGNLAFELGIAVLCLGTPILAAWNWYYNAEETPGVSLGRGFTVFVLSLVAGWMAVELFDAAGAGSWFPAGIIWVDGLILTLTLWGWVRG